MPPPWLLDPNEPLLRSPALALNAERNLVAGAGILSGGLLYTSIAGMGGPRGEGVFGNLFFFIGLAAFALCLIIAAGGVSRSVLAELRGEPRMGLLHVAAYLRQKWKKLILIPFAFCGLALAGIVALTFVAIAGAIPGVGPFLYALSFALSASFSILVVLVGLMLVLGSPLYPAALAFGDARVGEVMRELLSLVRRRPGRILLMEGVVALTCAAVGWAITRLLQWALWITVTISHPAMGDRFLRLVAGLPEPLAPLFEWLAGPLPFYFATAEGPAFYPVAGFMLGVSFLSLLAAAFALPFTLLVTGGTALYASLRSMEDSADS